MAKRKVYETAATAIRETRAVLVTVAVRRDVEWDEFDIVVSVNGVRQADCDAYEDDRQCAIGTAHAMLADLCNRDWIFTIGA